MEITIPIDTRVNGYIFINFKIARVLYNHLYISPSRLVKLKVVKAFNSKLATPITYRVYPILEVASYRKSTILLLITNLGSHNMILDLPWLQKYRVVLDTDAGCLLFKPRYCQH